MNPFITYERQPLHEDHEVLELKGFVGRPNDTEPNWRRLLERKSNNGSLTDRGSSSMAPAMNFKATEEELLRANIEIDDKIVRVSRGGYVGVLSVYHELHCLVSHAFPVI